MYKNISSAFHSPFHVKILETLEWLHM